jgi:hypothetical protein
LTKKIDAKKALNQLNYEKHIKNTLKTIIYIKDK